MRGSKERWKRNPDRWRIRVSAGRHPVTGQRRRLTKIIEAPHTAKAERDIVDPALRALLADAALLRGDPNALDGMTVAELADRFLDHRSRSVRYRTLVEYRAALARVTPLLGNMRVDQVRPLIIDNLYAQLAAEGVTASALVKVHRTLKAMFNQAVRWQLCPTNPVLGVDAPTSTSKRVTPPDPERFKAAMALLDDIDPDLAAFCRIAAWTGARRGEVAALRWDHVDLEAGWWPTSDGTKARTGAILIDSTIAPVEGGRWEVGPTKTNTEQVLAIGPKAVAVLEAQRARLADRAAALGVPPGPWVFPTDHTDPHALPAPTKWTEKWRYRRPAIGMDGVRLHDLRHYVGTQLYAGGFDPVAVAHRLTHRSKTLSLTTYSAAIPARDLDAAIHLENL